MVHRPTLKDVAEIAGVSEMTASRVLRGLGEASVATTERVRAAAASIGYVPNRIAGSLSSRSVNLVGVVVPSLSSFVFAEVLGGITDVLDSTPLQPVFGVSNYALEREENVIREMLSWRPSGLIVAGLEHTPNARLLLQNAGIPIVEIMDVDGDPVDLNVGVSHEEAGRAMARAMLERGYRRIGFVGTTMPLDFRAAKRLKGFEATLAEAGLALIDRALYTESSSLKRGRDMTAEILARSPSIEALYYSSDMLSCGGLMHCLMHGIKVPDKLALAGFNGLELRDGMPLRPASSDAFRREIGREAAQMILDRRAGKSTRAKKVVFTPQIDPGDTL